MKRFLFFIVGSFLILMMWIPTVRAQAVDISVDYEKVFRQFTVWAGDLIAFRIRGLDAAGNRIILRINNADVNNNKAHQMIMNHCRNSSRLAMNRGRKYQFKIIGNGEAIVDGDGGLAKQVDLSDPTHFLVCIVEEIGIE